MAIQIIKMPDIGEGIAEVELVAWHVKVGDVVKEDQILADVMTDKATVEIPSSVNGTVLALGGEVGQVMAVGSEVIRIETAQAEAAPHANPSAGQAASATVPAPSTSQDDKTASSPTPPTKGQAERQQPYASIHSPATITSAAPPSREPLGEAKRSLAAPAVRQRARELGVELNQLHGSDPQGRITHADLDAWLRSQTTSHAAGTSTTPNLVADATGEQTIAVIGLRRKIAQKMQESKRHIPHFTYVEEIDVTELETLRAQLNAEHGATRGKLTLLPFLIRAMVLAVRFHPEVNARYDDEAAVVTRYQAVHLGVATQTDAGLMVPVMRNAQTLDLWACAAEVTRLAEAARSGKATRDELTGSNLTLTSLGALGGIASTPVINHPEVAIVGTNRIVERPVILNGAVVARKLMNLSSSFDHRVVDGMNAAQFIQRVRRLLECPALLFVP